LMNGSPHGSYSSKVEYSPSTCQENAPCGCLRVY
jgi:hypothetical protein